MTTELDTPVEIDVDMYSLYSTYSAVRKCAPGSTFAFTEHGNSVKAMSEVDLLRAINAFCASGGMPRSTQVTSFAADNSHVTLQANKLEQLITLSRDLATSG